LGSDFSAAPWHSLRLDDDDASSVFCAEIETFSSDETDALRLDCESQRRSPFPDGVHGVEMVDSSSEMYFLKSGELMNFCNRFRESSL
jgi:hypothetical protein